MNPLRSSRRLARGGALLCASLFSIAAPGISDDPASGSAPSPSGSSAASTNETDELDRKVEEVTAKMRQAQTKLSGQDTGAATQELQKAIIAEIDELLKQPPQPNKSNSGGGGGGGSSSNNSSSGQGKKSSAQQGGASTSNSQSRGRQQSAGNQSMSAGEQPGGTEQERPDAEDSEERTGQTKEGKPPPLPRRRMEVDVWGHLPDKVREKLLSAYGERMVPQYEDLVQRFYRSLAETGTSGNQRPLPGRPNR